MTRRFNVSPIAPTMRTSLGRSIASHVNHILMIVVFAPTVQLDEALNGLDQNADPKSQEKDAIEEGTECRGPFPAVRVVLGRVFVLLRDLAGMSDHGRKSS